MLTFMMIPNAENFFRIVEESQGEVTLCLPDGGRRDLKRDPAARQLVRTLRPGGEGLRVSLSDRGDTTAFFRYMQEAALSA